MKSTMSAPAGARQAALECAIVRCACGSPETHRGKPCPQGRLERLGTVAYYHRSPWKRLLYRLRRVFRPRCTVWEKS